jgi:hypothetical protein
VPDGKAFAAIHVVAQHANLRMGGSDFHGVVRRAVIHHDGFNGEVFPPHVILNRRQRAGDAARLIVSGNHNAEKRFGHGAKLYQNFEARSQEPRVEAGS